MSNYPEGVTTGPWDEEVCESCETKHGKHDHCPEEHIDYFEEARRLKGTRQ